MATEKRLILLQDAIDIIANTPSEIAYHVTDGRKKNWTANDVLGVLADRQFEIFVLLDNVKRVDAVEVVHGWWDDSQFGFMYCDTVCSVCKSHSNSFYNYCPNCGAKMDSDGNDADY